MNRRIALLVAVVALVGLAGIAAAGPVGSVVAQDDAGTADGDAGSDGTEATNETADISPGERLSGVIGVQNAEVSGEVESRAFEVGLDRATTDEERAAVVGDRLDRSEQRLAEIEARQQELRESRDAGELSEGAFAARMAETSARAEQVRRDANRSADVARSLPAEARAERGLDDDRLNRLRERAGNASGPEIAAIARGVAGNDVGGPLAQNRRGSPNGTPGVPDGPPGETGAPGGGPENASADGDTTGPGENASDRAGRDGRAGDGAGSVGGNSDSAGAAGGNSEGTGSAGGNSEGTGSAGGNSEGTGSAGGNSDGAGSAGGTGGGADRPSTAENRAGNATNSDRRSVSGAAASLRTAAVERATIGWSTAAEAAATADSRIRDGVAGLGSLAGPADSRVSLDDLARH